MSELGGMYVEDKEDSNNGDNGDSDGVNDEENIPGGKWTHETNDDPNKQVEIVAKDRV